MHTFSRLPLAALLVGLLAGCPSEPQPTPEELLPPAPVVVSFRARQVQMEAKGQLLLEWETTGSSQVTITDSNRGVVSGVDDQSSGAVEIAPLERDTLFVLVAKNARGVSTSAMTTLRVSEGVGEMIFVATPSTVSAGDPVTLAWSVPGGGDFAITANDLPVAITERTSQGTLQVFPQRDTIYKLGAGGRELSSQVHVQSALKSFNISSLSGLPGERLTLTWETRGATSVVLSEGHAGTLVNASLAQQPEQLSSGRYIFTIPVTSSLEDIFDFTLVMTDGSGTMHKAQVTAYVSGRPRVVSLEAPALARRGSTFPLTWTAISVERVEIDFEGEVVYRSSDRKAASTGELEIPTPAVSGTFTLTAFNERGGSDARSFVIDSVGAPQITSIGITPDTVNGGTIAEATWVVAEARHAVLRDAQGRLVAERSGIAADGTVTVQLYPNATGTYSLEIDNGLGETATLESGLVTVPNPVVLVPDLDGALIQGTPVLLTPSAGAPGSLLYGVFHDIYTEQAPSTGFIDISATGTKLNSGSSDSGWFDFTPVGFDPLVFGERYSGKIWVCANGYLAFRETGGTCSNGNDKLPNSSLGERVLVALWDDLQVMSGYGGIYWELVGTGEDRVLIVQWDRVTDWYAQDTSEYTFQIQLRLDGTVRFEYTTIRGGSTGFVPTVGVQRDLLSAAAYPVKPAVNSRIEFLGPKPAPLPVTVNGQPVQALMKFGDSFMQVGWTPEHVLFPGDLAFSEVMARPAGEVSETGEYFEIFNRTSRPISLEGFSVQDANGSNLLTFTAANGPMTVPAAGFLVVGQSVSPSENDGAGVGYAYGPALLPDMQGELGLVKRVPIDTLRYAQGPDDQPGVALVFDANPFIAATDNQPSAGPAIPHPIACAVGLDQTFGSQTPPQRGTPGRASRCFPYTLSRIPVQFEDLSPTPSLGQFTTTSWDAGMKRIDLSAMPIPVFGEMRTAVNLNANGFLTFDLNHTSTTSGHSSSTVKPTSSTPAAALVPYGRDLRGGSTGSNVFVALLPEDPTRPTPDAHWVFQWYKTEIAGTEADLNFEVKLFKDGTVEFHYGTMEGDFADGSDATIWVENPEETLALVIGAQAPVLAPNTAYRFSP